MRKAGTHSRNETQQQLLRPQEESDRILSALVTMSNRLGRPLAEERIQQWLQDLNSYPVDAIEWALESWARNSSKLPALADLLVLIRSWYSTEAPSDSCDIFCKQGHGTGYDWNDLKWLWKRVAPLGRKPTDAEWIALFKELNRTRKGGTPQAFQGLPENWMCE